MINWQNFVEIGKRTKKVFGTNFFHFVDFSDFLILMRGFAIKSSANRPETFRSEFCVSDLPSLLQITGIGGRLVPNVFLEGFISEPETTDFVLRRFWRVVARYYAANDTF